MYAYLETDYSKLYLIDEVDPPVTHGVNRVDMHIDGVYNGSFLAAGYGGSTVENQYPAPLVWNSRLTTLGNRWIFEIVPSGIDANAVELPAGVLTFVVYTNDTIVSTYDEFGIVNDKYLACCMANHLSSTDNECDLTSAAGDVNLVQAYLTASKGALAIGDIDLAVCNYKNAKCIDCDTCL